MIFSLLPEDIFRHILLYSGKIKYRNGKYMNQICKEDERYKLLRRIPRINPDITNENVYGMAIYEHVYNKCISQPTNTVFSVDLENDDKIIYTFCYDFAENPDIYHIWIRE